MERLVCAVFDRPQDAEAAVKHLLADGVDENLLSVVVHRDHLEHADVEYAGTKARARVVEGAVLGGLLGAAVGGLILGPVGLIGVGPVAAALFGAGGGTVYGAVGGVITGRDSDKEVVRRLAEYVEQGKVVITIDVAGLDTAIDVARRLDETGGQRIQLA